MTTEATTDGLRRITPEEVRAAYLKTGWTPKRGMFSNEDKTCGCALGVLAKAKGFPWYPGDFEMRLKGTCRFWYTAGFDGDKEPSDEVVEMFSPGENETALLAHADGLAAWNAVQDLISATTTEATL